MNNNAIPQEPIEYQQLDKPLAKISLSTLMEGNDTGCPLCGDKLPIETRLQQIDNETWIVCKKCRTA